MSGKIKLCHNISQTYYTSSAIWKNKLHTMSYFSVISKFSGCQFKYSSWVSTKCVIDFFDTISFYMTKKYLVFSIIAFASAIILLALFWISCSLFIKLFFPLYYDFISCEALLVIVYTIEGELHFIIISCAELSVLLASHICCALLTQSEGSHSLRLLQLLNFSIKASCLKVITSQKGLLGDDILMWYACSSTITISLIRT